jgi:hypothetical protein
MLKENLIDDFTKATVEDLKGVVPVAEEGIKQNRLFLDGDHWQDATGWIGPRPLSDAANLAQFKDTMGEIETAFMSKNIIEEVLVRHKDAIVSREPNWSFTVRRPLKDDSGQKDDRGKPIPEKPTDAEMKIIEEVGAGMVDWWDKRKLLKIVQELTETLLNEGRAVVRIFIPPSETTSISGVTSIPKGSFTDSLNRIYIETLDNDKATVYQHPTTLKQLGIHLSKRPDTQKEIAETCYLSESGQTIIRVVADNEETAAFDLGGNLTIHELHEKTLISEQVRQLQRLYNMAYTMMTRNVVSAGFRERVMTNAHLPGDKRVDPTTGETKFYPRIFEIGAGSVQNLIGLEVSDEGGGKSRMTPSYQIFEPVSVGTFTDTASAAYMAILEQVHQLHAAITGDATASGESRIQAKHDFRSRVLLSKAELDAMIRWILETVSALAANIAKNAKQVLSLRAVCDTRIDIGPPGAGEISSAIELQTNKDWSRQRVQVYTGVEDPDAEDAQIASENPGDELDLEQKKLDVESARTFNEQLSGEQPPVAEQGEGGEGGRGTAGGQ